MRFLKVLLFSVAIAYGVQKGVSSFLEKYFLQQSQTRAPALAYDTAVTLQKAEKSNPSLLTVTTSTSQSAPDLRTPATDPSVSETFDPPLKVSFLEFDVSDETMEQMNDPDFQTKLASLIQNDPDRIFGELSGMLNENFSTPQMLNLIELTKRVCEIECPESLKTPLEQIAQKAAHGETSNDKLVGQKAVGVLLAKIRDPAEGSELLERLGIPIHQPQ